MKPYCTIQLIEDLGDGSPRWRWTYYLGGEEGGGGCSLQEWRWDAQDQAFRWETVFDRGPDAPAFLAQAIARLERARRGGDQSGAVRTPEENLEERWRTAPS